MRTRRALLLVGSLVSCYSLAYAGAEVMAEFRDERGRTPEVLAHVPLKAVVAEFLDPLDTGLGKSLGYLLWRETLTAISDQAGAGVIVAEAPPQERLVDMLKRDYHRAALRIAKHQRARMSLWGAVETDAGEVFINTYLSVLTKETQGDLRFALDKRFRGDAALRERMAHGVSKGVALEAPISRTRFNFAMQIRTHSELFQRPIVTRQPLVIRARGSKDAPVLGRTSSGERLDAIGMQGGWFEIQLEDGKTGYVSAGIDSALDLPPRQVEADRNNINLRAGPGTDHRILTSTNLKGSYKVLDMRYRQGKGLWYQIDIDGRPAWVAAFLVKPRFSVPAVHFLAGLYRYYAGRHKDAASEFQRFIDHSGESPNNANLATAHQLLGASLLLDNQTRRGYEAFSRAIQLTPYDPDAYLLRGVAAFGTRRAPAGLKDLDSALALDRHYRPARSLAQAVKTIADGRDDMFMEHLTNLSRYRRDVDEVLQKHQLGLTSPQ